MNPRSFLDVAGEWAVGTCEAEWRSAASRAYYAAFHVAGRLLRQVGFAVPPDQGAHAYVWLRLSNTRVSLIDEAGRRLQSLRRARGWADYDLDRVFDEMLAVAQVNEAMSVITSLDDLATTPAILAEVVTAIREYERDVLRDVTWRGP